MRVLDYLKVIFKRRKCPHGPLVVLDGEDLRNYMFGVLGVPQAPQSGVFPTAWRVPQIAPTRGLVQEKHSTPGLPQVKKGRGGEGSPGPAGPRGCHPDPATGGASCNDVEGPCEHVNGVRKAANALK